MRLLLLFATLGAASAASPLRGPLTNTSMCRDTPGWRVTFEDEFEGDATSRESCEETGNAYLASGYWIEQDTSQPPPRVSDEDLDVRCGAQVSIIVPVNGGNDEAARLGSYKGTRWGTTPGTPTIGGK